MLKFKDNRQYIENEFEMAVFDNNTGLPIDELTAHLKSIQAQETDMPRQLVCANAYCRIRECWGSVRSS